jgi:hypothetical protein
MCTFEATLRPTVLTGARAALRWGRKLAAQPTSEVAMDRF